MKMTTYHDFSFLNGKVFSQVERSEYCGNEAIKFVLSDGRILYLTHEQDCCEYVFVESIVGNLEDLTGTPITFVDESHHKGSTEDGTETWTFYKLATIKGWVDIRFHGESNGYYSEAVYLLEEMGYDH